MAQLGKHPRDDTDNATTDSRTIEGGLPKRQEKRGRHISYINYQSFKSLTVIIWLVRKGLTVSEAVLMRTERPSKPQEQIEKPKQNKPSCATSSRQTVQRHQNGSQLQDSRPHASPKSRNEQASLSRPQDQARRRGHSTKELPVNHKGRGMKQHHQRPPWYFYIVFLPNSIYYGG